LEVPHSKNLIQKYRYAMIELDLLEEFLRGLWKFRLCLFLDILQIGGGTQYP
jgi:hypothetical protein